MTEPDGSGDPQSQGERHDRPEIDFDSAFDEIVKGFSLPVPHGVGPWPASEDLDDDEEDGAAPADAGPPAEEGDAPSGPAAVPSERWDPPVRRISIPGDAAPRPGSGGVEPAAEDDEEGYEPPDPPPFPRGDMVSRVAWGAVVGGPVFLLVAALLWQELPTFLLLVALTAFVGGFVTLVARMPQDHPDDPDDGAVV